MQTWRLRDVRVIGVRRGMVTLDEGPDGRPFDLPVDDETERTYASAFGDAGGQLVVSYYAPGEPAAPDPDLAGEVERLRALVAHLESSKGVLSAAVSRPARGVGQTWWFTCPSGNEAKLAMMVAAAAATADYQAALAGFKRLAKLMGREDADGPHAWLKVMAEMTGNDPETVPSAPDAPVGRDTAPDVAGDEHTPTMGKDGATLVTPDLPADVVDALDEYGEASMAFGIDVGTNAPQEDISIGTPTTVAVSRVDSDGKLLRYGVVKSYAVELHDYRHARREVVPPGALIGEHAVAERLINWHDAVS